MFRQAYHASICSLHDDKVEIRMRRTLIVLLASIAPIPILADTVLIEDVRIFNGVDAVLASGHVLVRDGLIDTISANPIAAPDGATVIAGDKRILTPGFIDLHV